MSPVKTMVIPKKDITHPLCADIASKPNKISLHTRRVDFQKTFRVLAPFSDQAEGSEATSCLDKGLAYINWSLSKMIGFIFFKSWVASSAFS